MTNFLTIDIGGTKCATAITSDAGVKRIESWKTSGSLENLDNVLSFYENYLAQGGQSVEAIGVCFGGPVDFRTSTVKRSVHVPGWQDFDFSRWGQERLGLPLAVDNDCKVGALAEQNHGQWNTSDLMYITVSTGIGAAVIAGGKLLRGCTNEAGEFGHIRVTDRPVQCSCGRMGCLERVCSGYWLEQDHGLPSAQLLADDSFLQEYSELFARALCSAVLLYNPAVVVIGGGVSRTGKRLTDAISKQLMMELGGWKHMIPRIEISPFDHTGVHLGAMDLARELL